MLHFKYEVEREIQIVNTGHSVEARLSNDSGTVIPMSHFKFDRDIL